MMLAYLQRAVNRAVQKGPIDMLLYSSHVVKNAAASAYIDLRYGGRISKDRLHLNDHRPDFNSLMHSEWRVLKAIFDQVEIKPDDVLVDVGCGDGRVINYWLSRGLQNKMIGIEIDEEVAADTRKRYARYSNVKIIYGDATLIKTTGTIFYAYNPFLGRPLQKLAERTKSATVVFYNYVDLSPFSDRKIEYLKSTRDELQYRAAIIHRSSH